MHLLAIGCLQPGQTILTKDGRQRSGQSAHGDSMGADQPVERSSRDRCQAGRTSLGVTGKMALSSLRLFSSLGVLGLCLNLVWRGRVDVSKCQASGREGLGGKVEAPSGVREP